MVLVQLGHVFTCVAVKEFSLDSIYLGASYVVNYGSDDGSVIPLALFRWENFCMSRDKLEYPSAFFYFANHLILVVLS